MLSQGSSEPAWYRINRLLLIHLGFHFNSNQILKDYELPYAYVDGAQYICLLFISYERRTVGKTADVRIVFSQHLGRHCHYFQIYRSSEYLDDDTMASIAICRPSACVVIRTPQWNKPRRTRRALVRLFVVYTIFAAGFYFKNYSLDAVVDLDPFGLSFLHLDQTKGEQRSVSNNYLRYDEAGVQPIPGTARSHTLPNAVPASRSIPRELSEDYEYHLSQRTNTSSRSIRRPQHKKGDYIWTHSYATDYRTLYLYNPSVLPLHNTVNDYADDDPDFLSNADLTALTGSDPTVRYLAAYRAYLGNNCFGPGINRREMMRAGEQISYLALALLDEKLDVIPGTDVLIDLNAGPNGNEKYYGQFMEDCRFFLLRGSLYLICNQRILRLSIRRTRNGATSDEAAGFATGNETARTPYLYPNIHGDGLEVILRAPPTQIASGKNFNLFRSRASTNHTSTQSSTGPYDYYIQLYPLPHSYRRISVPPQYIKDTFKANPKRIKRAQTSTAPLPRPSFDTPDAQHSILACDDPNGRNCTIPPKEVPFFTDENDHGTACCVSMELEGLGAVLVGISHTKLSPRNPFWRRDVHHRYDHFGRDRFVSRFLAYMPEPPFDILARSGWFCLGFAELEEGLREGGNTMAGRNTHARLDLFNDTYDCPIIHFASSFGEYVGNASRAIIAYGVNDCHPRMMVVEKEDVARLLLGRV